MVYECFIDSRARKIYPEKSKVWKVSLASEVVREAFRLLQEQEQLRDLRLNQLSKEIQAGIKEADSGSLIDGSSFVQELKQKISKRKP